MRFEIKRAPDGIGWELKGVPESPGEAVTTGEVAFMLVSLAKTVLESTVTGPGSMKTKLLVPQGSQIPR